jgi:peptide/nickel transport system substrate-binding protein
MMRQGIVGQTVTRRSMLRLVMLGSGAALLAACGQAPAAPAPAPAKPAESKPAETKPAAPAATTAPAAPAAQAPAQKPTEAKPAESKPSTAPAAAASAGGAAKKGGNLLFVHQQKATSLDANVWTATNAARIMRQIYDPLVWQPEGGKFVPGLAEKWEISSDGKVYTFTLRKDVKFHDGTPFNAAAVKATYDRMTDPATKSLQVGRLGPYDKTEVVDDYTVRVHLKEAFVPFLSNISEHYLAPASPTAVKELGDKFAMNPVATGPFKVKGWTDDTTLVLERNPDYTWGPEFWANRGPAHLDTITYRMVEETATRLIALENGEADIIDAPPPQDVQRVKDSGKFEVNAFVVPGMPEFSNINITNSPTSDIAVRKAMQHGVDRVALAELVFSGVYPPAYGPVTRGSWVYWKGVEDMYPYDPEKAKQLLDEAGWKVGAGGIREKDGKPLKVRHITTAGGFTQRSAEFIQGSLREIGFDYVVDAMAYEATVKRFIDNEYEVYRLFFALIDPHDVFYLAYHSSQIEGGGQFNRTRIKDPQLDALIESGAKEPDVAKRKAIYEQLQKIVMENAWILPNFDTALVHALQTRVKGFSVDLLGRPYMSNVWKDS